MKRGSKPEHSGQRRNPLQPGNVPWFHGNPVATGLWRAPTPGKEGAGGNEDPQERGRWGLGGSHHLEDFRGVMAGEPQACQLLAVNVTPAFKDRVQVLPAWEGGGAYCARVNFSQSKAWVGAAPQWAAQRHSQKRCWLHPSPLPVLSGENLFNGTLIAGLTFLMNSGMIFWSVR